MEHKSLPGINLEEIKTEVNKQIPSLNFHIPQVGQPFTI